jgi:hypothetical protein
VSTCWNAGTCNTLESALKGQRPASLVRLQILRAHSPQDIMSSALWVHPQLPRVAHHLTPANAPQQQSSQSQRHLHQPHNILKMEQKIAEMKPSKRYAPTSHHLSSTRRASHDVKTNGNLSEEIMRRKKLLDVRLLIPWLDVGLRTMRCTLSRRCKR